MVLPPHMSKLLTEVKGKGMSKIKQDADKQIGALPAVVDCWGKEQVEPGGWSSGVTAHCMLQPLLKVMIFGQ